MSSFFLIPFGWVKRCKLGSPCTQWRDIAGTIVYKQGMFQHAMFHCQRVPWWWINGFGATRILFSDKPLVSVIVIQGLENCVDYHYDSNSWLLGFYHFLGGLCRWAPVFVWKYPHVIKHFRSLIQPVCWANQSSMDEAVVLTCMSTFKHSNDHSEHL